VFNEVFVGFFGIPIQLIQREQRGRHRNEDFPRREAFLKKPMGKTSETSDDIGCSIILDASGNMFTTGTFNGTADIDPDPETMNLISESGSNDISNFNASGNFIWAKQMGKPAGGNGVLTVLHATANMFTTGIFKATVDFDPDAATYNLTSAGTSDIFISKLTNSPSALNNIPSLYPPSLSQPFRQRYFYRTKQQHQRHRRNIQHRRSAKASHSPAI